MLFIRRAKTQAGIGSLPIYPAIPKAILGERIGKRKSARTHRR